ncbi:hypothetical protein ACB092_06G051400 [Castanea dentata]
MGERAEGLFLYFVLFKKICKNIIRKRPFRFEKMWLTHDGYKTLIQNAWSFYSQGSRALQLQQKLKNVRKELYSWNKNVFGKDLQDSVKTVQDIRVDKELREDIENLMENEEIMWAQKARSTWIIQSDRNTTFFQTLVKQRRARNIILQNRGVRRY